MIPQHGRLELSAARLATNVALFQKRLGSTRLCATVKADAYGHGASILIPELQRMGVEWFCVYALPEAVDLAGAITEGSSPSNLLVIAPTVGGDMNLTPKTSAALATGQVRLNIGDAASADALDDFATRHLSIRLPVHMQVDTGLTRAGATPEEGIALARKIASLRHLKLEGVFAHLSHGDEAGHPTITRQCGVLNEFAAATRRFVPELLVHIQNSGGAWNLGSAGLGMARVGIALYGLQPSIAEPIPSLLPVARLVAPILAIHDRPAGVGVGYGHTFVTARPSRLAIVPVGYAEGYPRQMSNRGIVQIREHTAPVVGRVSMDQIVIDVTDVRAASVGDEVIVISDDPTTPNSADRIAEACGTIGYEIATGFGARLERRLIVS